MAVFYLHSGKSRGTESRPPDGLFALIRDDARLCLVLAIAGEGFRFIDAIRGGEHYLRHGLDAVVRDQPDTILVPRLLPQGVQRSGGYAKEDLSVVDRRDVVGF